jgi:hypothetical protein
MWRLHNSTDYISPLLAGSVSVLTRLFTTRLCWGTFTPTPSPRHILCQTWSLPPQSTYPGLAKRRKQRNGIGMCKYAPKFVGNLWRSIAEIVF